ncbi:MAG: MFS transporter [Roseitalea porphyridii]|uniref:MFS transporter n=1 Tax=Roseitalea porphyridii TaxID=1852022 RepID=UPI0032ED4EA1
MSAPESPSPSMALVRDPRLPVLVVLLFCATLTVMAGATIAPTLPGLAAHFAGEPGGDRFVPLILTMPGLAIAIAAPLAGLIADRTFKRRILLAGIAVYIVAGSSGLYLDTVGAIIAARLMLGVAVGAIMTAATALIAELYTDAERGRILGFQAAAMSFGGMVFILSGGLLADLHWRAPFAIYLAPIVLVPFILARVPIGEPAPARTAQSAPTAAFPWGFALLVCMAPFANFLIYFTIPLKLPFMLSDMGLDSAALAGSAIAVMTFASGAVALVFGRIRAMAPPPLMASLAFLLCAAAFALLSLRPPVPVIFGLMVVVGLASGVILPNASTWLFTRMAPERRGQASGMMTMAVFLAQFLSAPMVLLVDPLGDATAAYMTAATLALATALFYVIAHHRLAGVHHER